MNANLRKEQFSIAYVRAISSVAGCSVARSDVDDDSIDMTLQKRGGDGCIRSPRLDLQLKCSARDVLQDEHLSFDLSIKNYNDLRDPAVLVPRILVVVLVPQHINSWLGQNEHEMSLRHCGYWVSLRDLPGTHNRSSVSVNLPRKQVFSVESLTDIMNRIGAGGLP